MTPSELASSLTAVMVGRGEGAVRVTINQDWVLQVHGVSYRAGVRLWPEQRSLEGAVSAIRAIAPWALPAAHWGQPRARVADWELVTKD